MATEVEETHELTLGDDVVLELESLNIKNLRKFMRAWTSWTTELVANMEKDDEDATKKDEVTMNDEQFDVYTELAVLCLEKSLKRAGKEFKSTDEIKEYLEDELNEKKLYFVLDVCGGLKLNDPNLQAAAIAAAQAQVGTN